MKTQPITRLLTIAGLAFAASLATVGCDQKEKVLDIETPAGEVEVERDKDSGSVDVEVDRDKK